MVDQRSRTDSPDPITTLRFWDSHYFRILYLVGCADCRYSLCRDSPPTFPKLCLSAWYLRIILWWLWITAVHNAAKIWPCEKSVITSLLARNATNRLLRIPSHPAHHPPVTLKTTSIGFSTRNSRSLKSIAEISAPFQNLLRASGVRP